MNETLLALLDELARFGTANDARETERPRRMLNITPATGRLLWILVRQARATLESLEAERIARQPQSDLFSVAPAPAEPAAAVEESAFAAAWRALDPDMLTPREALDALYRLKALEAPNQETP